LAGERRADAPGGNGHNGALRLITTSSEGESRYVDLIHETLLRARSRDPDSGERIGYWPRLYRYIEDNRDRDIVRQQLRFQTERWQHSRGLGRLWHLGLVGLGQYRPLRLPPGSGEARYLAWSRRARGALLTSALVLIGYGAESYVWSKRHELPLDAVVTLQRFRLGYTPLPAMVDIKAPDGAIALGDRDEAFVTGYAEKWWPNWGYPGTRAEIARDFRLGRYEITYDEYDYYVWQQHRSGNTGPKYPTTAKGGRGNRPVVNVNWHEAGAYAKWLGTRQGEKCRLPTEAEWEYAARAGTDSAYPWGDEAQPSDGGKVTPMANCHECGSRWDNEQSAPVGQFPANGFGLHDTSGNVWEWTCSPWRDAFDGSEATCAPPEDTGARAVRGGSWDGWCRPRALVRPPRLRPVRPLRLK
ncbi:MAG: SUMF1/EgtB/PvdO family nonheme iron enzyme, partial [Rhodocyclaceae bacterium]|nr:SUMF1/EgtB/PvdO family nonheme iron enzyme [Rhodocyclaceae bacterium]